MLIPATMTGNTGPKKKMVAKRISDPIRLDGVLSEEMWVDAMIATDFKQLEPNPGENAVNQTEVRVLYDNDAVYIGAILSVQNKESISSQIFERDQVDDEVQTDLFGVAFDTYMDGINGSGFIVGPSGSQLDIKFSSDDDDESWDAVWDAKITINDDSWVVEMKIPYAALRFPDQDQQTWHLQFFRKTFNLNEESFWNEIDPQVNGFFTQAGILEGIENIKSPVRLSATPFVALYTENYYDKNEIPKSSWGRSFNGGMDVKFGISDAFTLDMTLIPDFGQVRSDNQVLNLSPFEVRFDENRQFFTEGVELFNKAGLFYSRRVGGKPLYLDDIEEQLHEGEEIISNPGSAQLYNATKISGRTPGGTGLGLFNAVAKREYATISSAEGAERIVLTNPLTNYNVIAFDQNMKNNSYLSFINTNVLREGSAYDANVTGTEFKFWDKNNAYFIEGSGGLSQKHYSDSTDLGYKYRLEVGNQEGNLNWWASYSVESDHFDPNDLGFNNNNNEKGFAASIRYSQYEAFGPWLRMGGGIFGRMNWLYRFPDSEIEQQRKNLFMRAGAHLHWWATTKSFLRVRASSYFQPGYEYDYFEPRTPGRFYAQVPFYNFEIDLGTDNRKSLSIDFEGSYYTTKQKGREGWNFEINPSLRMSDRLSFGYALDFRHNFSDEGYVTDFGPDEIIFGRRNLKNVTNLLRANYAFSANSTLSFRLRHNWTQVNYKSFHQLKNDGFLEHSDYAENEDINFNAFTIDAVYRWRFAPGSDIFVVWKNAIVGEDDLSDIGFGKNLSTMFDHPQSNSFSIKFLYFLDYLDARKFVKGKRNDNTNQNDARLTDSYL